MSKPVNRNQLLKQYLRLQPADLNNRTTLAKFYTQSVIAGIWPNESARDVLDYMGLAAKAVHDDTYGTPGVLFWHLLTANARDRISNDNEKSVLSKWSSQDRFDLHQSTLANNNAQSTIHTQIPALTHDSGYENLSGQNNEMFCAKLYRICTTVLNDRHSAAQLIKSQLLCQLS